MTPTLLPIELHIVGRAEAEVMLSGPWHGFTHLFGFAGTDLLSAPSSRAYARGHHTVPHWQYWFFDDCGPSAARLGYIAASDEQLMSMVAHFRSVREGAKVLIHCEQGVGRSTAAAYTLLVMLLENERLALRHVMRLRDIARPNEHIVARADVLLGRKGAMTKELEHHRIARLLLPHEE